MDISQPLVGVGVMVCRKGTVLLTRRRGSHGAGEFSFPGGHLEHGETFEQCAVRETREEAGIEIKNLRFLYLTNSRFYVPKHYVHIGMVADWDHGEPRVMEPEKTEAWKWYPINEPPEKLFGFCEMAFRAYRTGEKYFHLPYDNSFRVGISG